MESSPIQFKAKSHWDVGIICWPVKDDYPNIPQAPLHKKKKKHQSSIPIINPVRCISYMPFLRAFRSVIERKLIGK